MQLLTFGKRTATVLGDKLEDLPANLSHTALGDDYRGSPSQNEPGDFKVVMVCFVASGSGINLPVVSEYLSGKVLNVNVTMSPSSKGDCQLCMQGEQSRVARGHQELLPASTSHSDVQSCICVTSEKQL